MKIKDNALEIYLDLFLLPAFFLYFSVNANKSSLSIILFWLLFEAIYGFKGFEILSSSSSFSPSVASSFCSHKRIGIPPEWLLCSNSNHLYYCFYYYICGFWIKDFGQLLLLCCYFAIWPFVIFVTVQLFSFYCGNNSIVLMM